jgi:hypothetical protein
MKKLIAVLLALTAIAGISNAQTQPKKTPKDAPLPKYEPYKWPKPHTGPKEPKPGPTKDTPQPKPMDLPKQPKPKKPKG